MNTKKILSAIWFWVKLPFLIIAFVLFVTWLGICALVGVTPSRKWHGIRNSESYIHKFPKDE